MKVLILIGLLVCVCLVSVTATGYVTNNVVHVAAHNDEGTWIKKLSWKPRWVKTWKAKTVYVALWKKVWGPVETKEYVPLPHPPPNWVKPITYLPHDSYYPKPAHYH